MKVLFLVNRCKHYQLEYIKSIITHCSEYDIIATYICDSNFIDVKRMIDNDHLLSDTKVIDERSRVYEWEIDQNKLRSEIKESIERMQPDVVHVLYYLHEEFTLIAREVITELNSNAVLIYENRDPSGTLSRGGKMPEQAALEAADGYLFVSEEVKNYYFYRYLYDAKPYLIIRQSEYYVDRDKPNKKLSEIDSKVHVTLIGTMLEEENHCRNYRSFIEEFVKKTNNTVLHVYSHHQPTYVVNLSEKYPERVINHYEDRTYVLSDEKKYTSTFSQYDYNIIYHSIWQEIDERETLRCCIPTKATSAIVLADLPFVCLPYYRGLIEMIDEYGCGSVYKDWDDLNRLFSKPQLMSRYIEGARQAAKQISHEAQSEKIIQFYKDLIAAR